MTNKLSETTLEDVISACCRGGKRTGAGRPARMTPRTALTLKVEPDVAEAFKKQCKDNDKSQVEQFTAMVKGK